MLVKTTAIDKGHDRSGLVAGPAHTVIMGAVRGRHRAGRVGERDTMSADHFYNLLGWLVRSEIALPELVPAEPALPDVTFTLGKLPDRLPGGKPISPVLEIASDERVCLRIPQVGRYLVEGGTKVVIEPMLPSDAPDIRVFLFGTVLTVLCLQRGLLPLHASAIECDGQAMVFAGASGSGKSSLAAVLSTRGYRLLADNLCTVVPDPRGQPIIFPALPQLRLWDDVMNVLAIPSDGLDRSRPQLRKYHCPVPRERFCPDPLPAARIVVLKTRAAGTDSAPRRLLGSKAMAQKRMVHGWRLAAALGLQAKMFERFALLLRCVPLFELARGDDPAGIHQLADDALALRAAK